MDLNRNEQRAEENARRAISEALQSSGAHQQAEARLASATARICFALFALFVSVLVFLFGLSLQEVTPVDGAVIKLLSAIPFLGGAWHLHHGHKVLRERATALQCKADEVARKTS